jgi:hypothetical protein
MKQFPLCRGLSQRISAPSRLCVRSLVASIVARSGKVPLNFGTTPTPTRRSFAPRHTSELSDFAENQSPQDILTAPLPTTATLPPYNKEMRPWCETSWCETLSWSPTRVCEPQQNWNWRKMLTNIGRPLDCEQMKQFPCRFAPFSHQGDTDCPEIESLAAARRVDRSHPAYAAGRFAPYRYGFNVGSLYILNWR